MALPSYYQWIDSQKSRAIEILHTWAGINTGTENTEGLFAMLMTLEKAYSTLGVESFAIPLPMWTKFVDFGKAQNYLLGNALSIKKRPTSKIQVLFGGHMDTVYPKDTAFVEAKLLDANKLGGPGVADMKGGLVVLLLALEAFEKYAQNTDLGWEVFISSDEEIGSVGSQLEWENRAGLFDIALIFEPSYPDGALVDARKGSATFTVTAAGKSAHAGRDFHSGKNAIKALAHFILDACELAEEYPEMTLNVGAIKGGGAVNIVPDQAFCRFNIRMSAIADLESIKSKLAILTKEITSHHSVMIELTLDNERPPKPFDDKSRELFDCLNACAKNQGYNLSRRPSGGVSDGNLLAAKGLPTIDTLGVIGGNLHTEEEYMFVDSLTSRAKLLCDFLIRLSQGEFSGLLRSNR